MKVRVVLSPYYRTLLVERACVSHLTLLMYILLIISLPADFLVWATRHGAAFLTRKLVWSNWDVEEMMAREKQIDEGDSMTLGLQGWPYNNYTSKTNNAIKSNGTNGTNGVNAY
jgi:hypothetical protein